MFGSCRSYTLDDLERQRKLCQSHWSAKYRSRSPGQCTCQVRRSGRSVMQGTMVVVELYSIRILILIIMSNFDINVQTNGRTNGWMNGKGDAYVANSGGQGDVSCKV